MSELRQNNLQVQAPPTQTEFTCTPLPIPSSLNMLIDFEKHRIVEYYLKEMVNAEQNMQLLCRNYAVM